jgi:hypothetical protein
MIVGVEFGAPQRDVREESAANDASPRLASR